MCETKRVAWRTEVPEHAQMGSFGGIKGQCWVFEGPRPSGNRKNIVWSKKKILRKKCFFLPQNRPFCPQVGPKWGPLGGLQGQFWVFEGPGPFGSRNNAKKIGKNWPILAQKDLKKFRAWAQIK